MSSFIEKHCTFLPTPDDSGVGPHFCRSFPQSRFPVGHDLPRLQIGMLLLQVAVEASVQANFSSGHHHGEEADDGWAILGNNVEDLRAPNLEGRDVTRKNGESPVDVKER